MGTGTILSCKRFVVSVPANGWLDAFLLMGGLPGGVRCRVLAGEVGPTAPDGRRASSDWQRTNPAIWRSFSRGNMARW